MTLAAKKLLNRLKADPRVADPEPARRRVELRSAVRTAGKVRQALTALGIDPAGVACFAEIDTAAAELAAIPDGPTLEAADAACLAMQGESDEIGGGDPRLVLLEKIMRMRANMGLDDCGPPPDFATAPLLSVYAWCLGEVNRRERQDPTLAR